MIFISFKAASLSLLLPELSISLWVGLNEESPPVDICNCIWPCICVCVVHVNEESDPVDISNCIWPCICVSVVHVIEESSPLGVCNCIRPSICICVIFVSGLASLRGRSLIDYRLTEKSLLQQISEKTTDHPKIFAAKKSEQKH